MKTENNEKQCPYCQTVLNVLLFLGIQPDGYVCPECRIWFDDTMKALAKVI